MNRQDRRVDELSMRLRAGRGRARKQVRPELESLDERVMLDGGGAANRLAEAMVAGRTPAPLINRPDSIPPTAQLSAQNVNSSNADSLNPYTFSITYADNVAVDRASVVLALVMVKPPVGSPLYASEESVTPSGTTDAAGDAREETAMYQLAPPGGSWGTAPAGRYMVILGGLPVTDMAGNPVVANVVGSFSVRIAVPRLVVLSQPPDLVSVGAPFELTAALENSQGNIVTSFNGKLTIALGKNPGGATLGGLLTAAARGGVAVFSGLTLDQPAQGYRLEVSGAGLHVTTAAIEAIDGEILGWGLPPQPSIVVLQVVETKRAASAIELFFSDPMDRATLTDLDNYALLGAGRGHEFGGPTEHVLRLDSARANALGDSVTLALKRPANLGNSLALLLNRQAPAGLRDASGAYLNPWGELSSPPKAVLFIGKLPPDVDSQYIGGNSAVLEVPTTFQRFA